MMPRHNCPCRQHCHVSKQGMADNSKAPLFALPPPPLCILLLPLPALFKPSTARSCCRQHKDITTTIVATISSLPANEGVHPCKECHVSLAVVPLLACGTLLGSPPPSGAAAAAPPPPLATPPPVAILARAVGRGVLDISYHESNQSPLRRTLLPPRRQRALCHHNSRSSRPAPLPPGPLAPHRGHTNQVPRGRAPTGNEVRIWAVGQWHTPPSSPPQLSQPAHPPILLCDQLICQSRL